MRSNIMSSIFVLKFTFLIFFFFLLSQIEPNKPTIFKTIHTKYGDIFDCVDIHKQPSLAHPLLQNHTIQMNPSFIPEASPLQKNKKYVQLELEDGGCPEGSVPIKRITEEDRIRLQTHLKKYPSALFPNNEQNPGGHIAGIYTKKMGITFMGARGLLNIYNPSVTKEQHSDSLIYVRNGSETTLNIIQAGWTVFPAVYRDNIVRLHSMWTADNFVKTGCIDIHCPGFVQVSRNIALGMAITPASQCCGDQYSIPISIYQDSKPSGSWWLIANLTVVGYWPKSLFTSLSESGDEAGWGGQAHGPEGVAVPMGSGLMPEEGYGKSCFVEEMQYVWTHPHQAIYDDLNLDMMLRRVDKINERYDVEVFIDENGKANIFFGGPGGDIS